MDFSAAACDVIDQHMGQKFTTPPTKEQEKNLLTPVAPSIAFPLANPPVAPEPEVRRKYLRYKDICKHFYVSIFLPEGKEGRKAATQISAVLPQPSGTHRLQSPHRGAW